MRLCWTLRSFFRYRNVREIKRIPKINLFISEYKYSTMASGERNVDVRCGLKLSACVDLLNKFADSYLAEDWDNVGLIVDHMTRTDVAVKKALLTIDLTEAVVDEAVEKNIDLIISYHPPLFRPVKELNKSNWKLFVVGLCAVNKIAVYSPHTAWDAIDGGVADWLLDAFVSHAVQEEKRQVLQPVKTCFTSKYNVTLGGPEAQILKVIEEFPFLTLCQRVERKCTFDYAVCNGFCSYEALLKLKQIPKVGVGSIECVENKKDVHLGMGRVMSVEALTIERCVDLVKQHTGLQHVRVALAVKHTNDFIVSRVAVLPGSGGSFLSYIKNVADVYVTGEMSHHEVLDATQSGTSVILLNHTESERGYLSAVKPKLEELFEHKVAFYVSQVDRDPLQVY